MGRKFTDKTHVGIRNEKKADGTIYVYRNTTKYDPVTKKTRSLKQELIGKILPNTKEIIPTRPKKKTKEKQDEYATKQHCGINDILNWIGKESHIDKDVENSFELGDYQKIISIARFMTVSSGLTLPNLKTWQITHETPYVGRITEDVYSDLFKNIGNNEGGVQRYFAHRAEKFTTPSVIAYDSTTVSTYSENLLAARQGKSKEDNNLDIIKLQTAFNILEEQPVMYIPQPGNIPDVSSVENQLIQFEAMGLNIEFTVADNGYYSEKNLDLFLKRKVPFLIRIDNNIKWVKDIIKGVKDKIMNYNNCCPFDEEIQGTTVIVSAKNKKAIENPNDKTVEKLYVHVFYSLNKYKTTRDSIVKQLFILQEKIRKGEKNFSSREEKYIKDFLVFEFEENNDPAIEKQDIYNSKVKTIEFNETALEEYMELQGFFVLLSDKVSKTFEALRYYRWREKIEDSYYIYKYYIDGRRPRNSSNESFQGKLFVQFVALGYYCFFKKKIKELIEALELPAPADTKKCDIILREKLLSWLKKTSIEEIFEWFSVEQTRTIKTQAAEYRFSTERIKRDQLFFELLGI